MNKLRMQSIYLINETDKPEKMKSIQIPTEDKIFEQLVNVS